MITQFCRRMPAVVLSVAAVTALGQPVLELHAPSLTSYLPVNVSPVQGLHPSVLHRGVGIDGTTRAVPAFAWHVAANPFPEDWNEHLRHGDVRLDVGALEIDETDLQLPSRGMPWVIGRTYNPVQSGGGSRYDSNGYQGWNWAQSSQPELVIVDNADDSLDMLYLLYGADRFLEFKRVMSGEKPTSVFRGVNGAAGAVTFEADSGGPDVYTYHDQIGDRIAFFGFDAAASPAQGQLWSMTDPAGNIAYVGSTSKSLAIGAGYDSAGRITAAFDAEGRRYTYTRQTLDGVSRLTQVKAEVGSGAAWTEAARVNYTFYTSTDVDIANGSPGDLKLVAVSTPLSDPSKTQRSVTYYRYWKGAYDAQSNPGYPHQLRLVVGPEGTRKFDWSDPSQTIRVLDDAFLGASYDDLNPYATAGLGAYEQGTGRLASAWYNGECGCGGGISGVHGYTYSDNPTTDPRLTAGYQNAWCCRTIVAPPTNLGSVTGTHVTQYFDEAGQPLSRVLTAGDPGGEPSGRWSYYVERDADGMLTSWHSPRNLLDDVTERYDHATGSFLPIADQGLVVRFPRVAAGALKGFLQGRKWRTGETGANEAYEWSVGYTTASKAVSPDYSVLGPFMSSRSEYTTTSSSSGVNTTDYVYAFHTGEGALAPKSIEIRQPNISSATNGPGGTARDSSTDYLRSDGTRAFRRERNGTLSYARMAGGLVSLHIDDANTNAADIAASDNPTTVWGIPAGSAGNNLVTRYAYDAQGRPDTTTMPDLRVARHYYARLDDGRTAALSIPKWDASTGTASGPVGYLIFNAEGNSEFDATAALIGGQSNAALSGWIQSNASNPIDDPIAAFSSSVGAIKRLTTVIRSKPGMREEESRTYFSVPAVGPGSAGANYDAKRNDFDAMGRVFRVTQPTGTIIRSEFDVRGLPVRKFVGTSDPNGPGFGPGDMSLVWTGKYDGVSQGTTDNGAGGTGDGDPSASECVYIAEMLLPPAPNRIYRDVRGRVIVVSRTAAPHIFYERDNLGRITAIGLYDNVDELITPDPQGVCLYENTTYSPRTFNGTASRRVALAEFAFDEQGRHFKTVRHNIDQGVAGLGQDLDSLTFLSWYDSAGRLAKQRSERLLKHQYDRLNRATHEFELAKDNDLTYADALGIAGDTVMTESQSVYDATTGTVLMSVVISRQHDDDYRRGAGMTTGPLDSNQDGGSSTMMKVTAADLAGRVQIEARWYDALGQLTTVARYGTFGGATFDRMGLPEPTSSTASALVTKLAYDGVGVVYDVQDPMGRHTRSVFDDADRTVKTIENYVDGVPGPNDQDRTTEYVYANTLLTQQIVRVPGGTDQVTTYTYGTSNSGGAVSEVATAHLLAKVEYPDKTDSTDVVSMLYTRQGRVKQITDQAGNIITLEYDGGFRLAKRSVAYAAPDFDPDVRSIATAYDALGQVQLVTQQDAFNNVLNEVAYTYDGWGNISKIAQDHDSALGGTHLYEVSYTHAKAAAAGTRQTVRRTGITLPDGTPVGFDYLVGTSSSPEPASVIDDQLSRVRRVTCGSTPTQVARYEYLGRDQLVGADYPQPGIASNRFGTTQGQYPGFDAFDRPIVDSWTKTGAPDLWKETLTYDVGSNVDRIVNQVLAGQDVDMTMDGLDRLIKSEEGTWSGTQITARTRQELWTLSQTGNWANHKKDRNGNNIFTDGGDLDDAATFNVFNEILQRDLYSNGQVVRTQAHDRVGNLTDDGESYKYVYDPFGRLVRVLSRQNPSRVVAEYSYDGSGELIAATYDTNGNGSITDEATERYVYDARWRIVAVYVTTAQGVTALKERYVRHNAGMDGLGNASYVDDIVLRDRDVSGPATLEERVYYCQNSHHDVSALVDAGGTVLERVKYWSYGAPRVYPRVDADWDHSGKVDQADLDLFLIKYQQGSLDCDLNGDGVVNQKDLDLYNEAWTNGWTVTEGLSVVCGNRFGYGGYLWDRHDRKYHDRFRVYDPALGRFLTRDPLEYSAGGANLYEYTGSRPFEGTDPLGLITDEMLERPQRPAPQPLVPRDGRPNRAPYDIYPGDTPDDIVRKQLPFLKRPPGPNKGMTNPWKEGLKGGSDGFLCWCEGMAEMGAEIGTLGIWNPKVRLPDTWKFDPNDPNLDTSRTMGKVSCVCLATAAACKVSKLRIEKGKFKFPRKTGPLKERWHFHIGPEELQKYHLPYEWYPWLKNGESILKRLIPWRFF